MTTTTARVRVVLVNYRSVADVAARLASDALRDAEVLVVDNASDPERVSELCRQHDATPILLAENRGFAAGVNSGWDAARERRPLPLLLLNPDAELSRDALDRLLEGLPGQDGVGPLLLERPGRPQVGVGGGPISVASVAAYFLFGSRLVPRWKGVFLTRAQSRRGGPVAWACMASLLLAPDALDRFGPLPDDEVVYAEDVAWGTSATRQGARFTVIPEAVVMHRHGASGSSAEWIGALERLLRRRLGVLRGTMAVLIMRSGLALRRLAGRNVRSLAQHQD